MNPRGVTDNVQTAVSAGLPVNAALIPRAEGLVGDPARGWYFSVFVRSTWARLVQQHSITTAE